MLQSFFSPMVVMLWVLTILVDTGGQLAFKAAAIQPYAEQDGAWARWRAMLTNVWLWVGIGCYIAEFILWLAFLSLVPLSVGILLGCINIVAVMLAGRYFFYEQLSPLRVSGIVLITLGVAVVGFF